MYFLIFIPNFGHTIPYSDSFLIFFFESKKNKKHIYNKQYKQGSHNIAIYHMM